MASRLRFVLLAASVAAATPTPAQVFVDARLGGALDSLRFLDDSPEDRVSASGFVGLEYRFAERRARLWYSLDAASYATPGDWTTLLHDAGGGYRVELSDSARLFLAGSATWRANGDAWAVAGYRALSARASLELRPARGRTLRLGYRLDDRDFSDLPELDQLEQDGFASALVNLQTRTTLIGEVHLGFKSYAGVTAAAPATAPLQTSGAGHGRGPGGMGPVLRPGLSSAPGGGESAGRLTWLLRVAQSLADRTGLSVQYEQRRSFGDVSPVLVTTPVSFENDGVYDDPYVSDGLRARVVLKHELARLGTLRAWGTWERDDYRATPALAVDGEPTAALREDRAWRAGAGWRLPLLGDSTGDLALDLDVSYGFTDHRSNDAFYDYTSHAVGAAITLAY